MKLIYIPIFILLSCSSLDENPRSNPFDQKANATLRVEISSNTDTYYSGKTYTFSAEIYTIVDRIEKFDQSHLVTNYSWSIPQSFSRKAKTAFASIGQKTIQLTIKLKNGSSYTVNKSISVVLQPVDASIKSNKNTLEFGEELTLTLNVSKNGDKYDNYNVITWNSNLNGDFSTVQTPTISTLYGGLHTITLNYILPDESDQRSITKEIIINEIPNISAVINTPQDNTNFNLNDDITFSATINKGANNTITSSGWFLGEKKLFDGPLFNSSDLLFKSGVNTIEFRYAIEDHYERSEYVDLIINYPGIFVDYSDNIEIKQIFTKDEHVFINTRHGHGYYYNIKTQKQTIFNSTLIKDIILFNSNFLLNKTTYLSESTDDKFEIKRYTPPSNRTINSFTIGESNHIYLIEDYNTSPHNSYLVKLTENFEVLWRKDLGESQKGGGVVYNNAGLFVSSYDKYTFFKSYIKKFDFNGNLLNTASYDGGNVLLISNQENGAFFRVINPFQNSTLYGKVSNDFTISTYIKSGNHSSFYILAHHLSNGVIFESEGSQTPYFDNNFNFVQDILPYPGTAFTLNIYNDEIFISYGHRLFKRSNNLTLMLDITFENEYNYPILKTFNYNNELYGAGLIENKLWIYKIDPATGDFIY